MNLYNKKVADLFPLETGDYLNWLRRRPNGTQKLERVHKLVHTWLHTHLREQ